MNVFNMPSQPTHGRYKARGLADFDWKRNRLVRLEISVGQPYHEGAKMQAALDWADKNFEKKVLLLGDTLQRYNLMMEGVSASEARSLALDAGNRWLDRHAAMVKDVPVLRWDEILIHKDFLQIRKTVGDLYRQNKHVKMLIDESIQEIAVRRQVEDVNDTHFFDLSLQYLLEEIAGTVIENQLYPGVSAYPGSVPKFWGVIDRVFPAGNDDDDAQYASGCIQLRMKRC